MISKNWHGKSVLACVITSLIAGAAAAQTKTPAIALVDGADAGQWQAWTRDLGWRVLVPTAKPDANIDARVLDLEGVVQGAVKDGSVDPARVYLAGRGEGTAVVFYAISRVPDLWAAGLAASGAPQAAVDTNRVFAANFGNVPVLWVGSGPEDEALAGKLRDAGLNLEWRQAAGATAGSLIEWLAGHTRDEFPAAIDCETNSPQFARCYWIRMTKFDPAERNDVLPTSLVRGGTGAYLDLGGFGYKAGDPGPGLLVSFLPPKYSGPLKMGDRIIALDGRPIENGRKFAETMAKADEEKTAVAMVQRGKDRIRVDARIALPRREATVTAHVQASYSPAEKSIQIISRTVTEMQVTIPPQWVPGSLFWNGLSIEDLGKPGCYLLRIEKELLRAGPCGS
jgi:hypothetical protein